MGRVLYFSLLIFAISVCTGCLSSNKTDFDALMNRQIQELGEAEKESLEKNLVIIRGDLIFVGTNDVNGTELSELIISPALIKNAEDRFLISHFLRNVLISGAVIKNFDENGNEFTDKKSASGFERKNDPGRRDCSCLGRCFL